MQHHITTYIYTVTIQLLNYIFYHILAKLPYVLKVNPPCTNPARPSTKAASKASGLRPLMALERLWLGMVISFGVWLETGYRKIQWLISMFPSKSLKLSFGVYRYTHVYPIFRHTHLADWDCLPMLRDDVVQVSNSPGQPLELFYCGFLLLQNTASRLSNSCGGFRQYSEPRRCDPNLALPSPQLEG